MTDATVQAIRELQAERSRIITRRLNRIVAVKRIQMKADLDQIRIKECERKVNEAVWADQP